MLYNQLKSKPEHISQLIACLKDGVTLSPNEIVKRTNLSLTATYGAINELEINGKIIVIRQDKTPKMRVQLPTTT